MAYGRSFRRKTYSKKRSFRRPRSYKRRSFKRKSFRKAVKKIAYTAQETKITGYDLDPFNVNSTWQLFPLLAMPVQGINQIQRIGDTIKPTYLKGKIVITPDDVTGNAFRVLILRWKPEQAFDPCTISKVFKNTFGTNSTNSLYIDDNLGRSKFDILWDRSYALESNKTVMVPNLYVPLKKTMKFPATTGDPVSGTIWMGVCSDSAFGAASHPKISFSTRFHFKDA